jgi:hypothetical protein
LAEKRTTTTTAAALKQQQQYEKVFKIYKYCRLIYCEKNAIFNAKSPQNGVFSNQLGSL